MKTTVLATVLALTATAAFATPNNDHNPTTEVNQTANLNAAALANAQAQAKANAAALAASKSIAKGGDATANGGNAEATGGTGGTGGDVGDITNRGDKTTVYAAPPAVAPDLPSGSNDELAPEGMSFGLSTIFGGVGAGYSTQHPTPSAGNVLISQAVLAAQVNSENVTPADRLKAEATARFLCGEYSYMVPASVCDSVKD